MPSQSPSETTHSLLLSHLSTKTNTTDDLHQTLLSSLQRAGWTERVRAIAIELLRAGRAETFDEVFQEVVGLVVSGKAAAAGGGSGGVSSGSSTGVNGVAAENGNGNGVEDEDKDAEGEEEEGSSGGGGQGAGNEGHMNGNVANGSGSGSWNINGALNGIASGQIEDIDVRIPEAVVGEGMRFLQEALDGVLSTDGEGDEEDANGEEDTQNNGVAATEGEDKKPPTEKASNGSGKRSRDDGDAEKDTAAAKKAKGVGAKGK